MQFSDIENPEVSRVFESYPPHMRTRMIRLRQLIIETAHETEGVDALEETLKWDEPAYLTKGGSTIRIDWKKKTPNQYAIYFICTTPLVETFRELYGELLDFQGNRAIVFSESDELPVDALKHCISVALTYHKVKHLSMLGA